MNVRLPRLIAALGCTLVLSHCGGGIEVIRSAVGDEQLASYSTYAWSSKRGLDLNDPDADSAAVNRRILRAVNRGLQDKGMKQVSAGGADLLVSYNAVSRRVAETRDSDPGGGRPSPGTVRTKRFKVPEPAEGTSETVEAAAAVEQEEGKLSIEITDRRTGKPVYRGSAEAVLFDDPSEWKADMGLQEAVTRMLLDFPRR